MISDKAFTKQEIARILGITCILVLAVPFIHAQMTEPEMVFVKGGKFKMGTVTGGGDDQPVHDVVLDDFYIGKFEVTQQQWRTIMDQDTNKCYFEGCDSCPVERVSWYNVLEYIAKLNDTLKTNYRLPTEAEWEYAARGGTLSKGYKYSGSNSDEGVAWKVRSSNAMTHPDGKKQSKTHPVGLKKPNELGIYDMTGNVFEWCNDWYSSSWYKISPKKGPEGPSEGTFKVIRGGSWFFDHAGLRTTDRESANPSYRYGYIGFRLCRSASGEKKPSAVPGKPPAGNKTPQDTTQNKILKKFIGF